MAYFDVYGSGLLKNRHTPIYGAGGNGKICLKIPRATAEPGNAILALFAEKNIEYI
jgi:hypothetical protein